MESLATDRIEKNEEACGTIEHNAQVIKDVSDCAVFRVEADNGCNDVQRPLDAQEEHKNDGTSKPSFGLLIVIQKFLMLGLELNSYNEAC